MADPFEYQTGFELPCMTQTLAIVQGPTLQLVEHSFFAPDLNQRPQVYFELEAEGNPVIYLYIEAANRVFGPGNFEGWQFRVALPSCYGRGEEKGKFAPRSYSTAVVTNYSAKTHKGYIALPRNLINEIMSGKTRLI